MVSKPLQTQIIPNYARRRLLKDYMELQREPNPYVEAEPYESNFLDWKYVVTGPPDSRYEGYTYCGSLLFPENYPLEAPTIIETKTPTGATTTEFLTCLSTRDWDPTWTVSNILLNLFSTMNDPTTSLVDYPDDTWSRKYAQLIDLTEFEDDPTTSMVDYPDDTPSGKCAQRRRVRLAAKQVMARIACSRAKSKNDPTSRVNRHYYPKSPWSSVDSSEPSSGTRTMPENNPISVVGDWDSYLKMIVDTSELRSDISTMSESDPNSEVNSDIVPALSSVEFSEFCNSTYARKYQERKIKKQ